MREQLPHEVAERIQKGEKFEILDVREHDEWESGHIPEARHIPLGELQGRHNELSKDREMVVVCRSGKRSGVACDLLSTLGYKVVNMPGGMSMWPGQVKFGK